MTDLVYPRIHNRTRYNQRGKNATIIFILIFSFFSNTICFFSVPYLRFGFVMLIFLFPMIFFLNSGVNSRLYGIDTFWILFLLVLLVGVAFSCDYGQAMSIVLVKLTFYITFFYLARVGNWCELFLKGLCVCSALYVASSYMQILAPNLVATIVRIILPAGAYVANQELYEAGYITGIAGQVSYMAHFIMPLIAVIYCRLLCKKKNIIWQLIMLILAIGAMIATGKRGPLAAMLLAIAGCTLLSTIQIKKGKLRSLTILACIVLVGLYILLYSDAGALLYTRLGNTVGIDSVRDHLWRRTIQLWQSSPVIGVGTNYFSQNSSLSTHNSYLQILCENGLLGLIFYLGIMIAGIAKTIDVFKKTANEATIRSSILSALFIQLFCAIHSLTDSVYANDIMFLPLVISMAIPYSVKHERYERSDAH